jgi:hypothetical protein
VDTRRVIGPQVEIPIPPFFGEWMDVSGARLAAADGPLKIIHPRYARISVRMQSAAAMQFTSGCLRKPLFLHEASPRR